MKQNIPVAETLKKSMAVKAVPRLVVEFNHNRYANPTPENSPSESVVARDPDIFPIDSIVEPHRPHRGAVKATVDNAVVTDYSPLPPDVRFHITDADDTYKYWSSPTPTVAVLTEEEQTDDETENVGDEPVYAFGPHPDGTYPTDCNPQVTYDTLLTANKIIIGLENSVSSPTEYDIYIQEFIEGSWIKVADETDTEIDDDGRIILYRGTSAWSSTKILDYETEIAGIQMRVSAMDQEGQFLELIEIAALLEKDISEYSQNNEVTMDLGDTNATSPIGRISSNVANINLFNALVDINDVEKGLLFNNENTDSIFYGLLKENAKFTLDYLYDASEYDGEVDEEVREFVMYAENNWSADLEESVNIAVRDVSKVLQEVACPDTFFDSVGKMSIGQIVWMLLDAVGFVDYNIDIDDTAEPLGFDFFWVTKETKVWEILSSLAEGTQTAIYVDSYGILQIKTKEAAFNAAAESAWHFRGEDEGEELADLALHTNERKPITNNVTITYKPTNYKKTANDNYLSELMWEPDTETVILRSTDLQKTLSVGAEYLSISALEATDWPYKGMIQVEGELISYEGKEFNYYPSAEFYTEEDLTSPVNINERFATLNMNGNVSTPRPLGPRLPVMAQKIIDSGASIVGLQEANSASEVSGNQPLALRNAIHALGQTGWAVYYTFNLNAILVDTKVWDTNGVVTNTLLGKGPSSSPMKRYVGSIVVKHKVTGTQLTYWTAHFTPGKKNDPTRAKHTKVLISWLASIGPAVGGGDLNTYSYASTKPLGLLKAAGHIDSRTQVANPVNNNLDSYDSYGSNNLNGRWLDHVIMSNGPKATGSGLVDSGNGSDHNIVYADVALGTGIGIKKKYALLKSADDYKKYHYMSNVSQQYLNKFTGRLKITERAMWNTEEAEHKIGPYPYSQFKIGSTGNKYAASALKAYGSEKTNILNGEQQYQTQKAVVAVDARSNTNAKTFYHAQYPGNINGVSPIFYGTKFQIANGGSNNLGGLALSTNTSNGSGYYVEIRPTAQVTSTSREIVVYSKYITGKIVKLNGKGWRANIAKNVWYSLDVQLSNTGSDHYIMVWLNGKYLGKAKAEGTPKRAATDSFGMYVRGSSDFEYEYLYAFDRTSLDQDTPYWGDDTSFYDRVTNGYISKQFVDEFRYGTRASSRRVKKKNVAFTQRYKTRFFDEFSPVCHEIREFDVKYSDKLPGNSVKLLATNEATAKYMDFRGTPFGAHFYAINVSHNDVEIHGENERLGIMSQNIAQEEDKSVVFRNEASIRTSGLKEDTITSPWIQSEDQANNLGAWITSHWGSDTDEISAVVFGNPLIELTDIVDITDKQSDKVAEKYFVIAITNDFEEGISTTLRLRKVNI